MLQDVAAQSDSTDEENEALQLVLSLLNDGATDADRAVVLQAQQDVLQEIGTLGEASPLMAQAKQMISQHSDPQVVRRKVEEMVNFAKALHEQQTHALHVHAQPVHVPHVAEVVQPQEPKSVTDHRALFYGAAPLRVSKPVVSETVVQAVTAPAHPIVQETSVEVPVVEKETVFVEQKIVQDVVSTIVEQEPVAVSENVKVTVEAVSVVPVKAEPKAEVSEVVLQKEVTPVVVMNVQEEVVAAVIPEAKVDANAVQEKTVADVIVTELRPAVIAKTPAPVLSVIIEDDHVVEVSKEVSENPVRIKAVVAEVAQQELHVVSDDVEVTEEVSHTIVLEDAVEPVVMKLVHDWTMNEEMVDVLIERSLPDTHHVHLETDIAQPIVKEVFSFEANDAAPLVLKVVPKKMSGEKILTNFLPDVIADITIPVVKLQTETKVAVAPQQDKPSREFKTTGQVLTHMQPLVFEEEMEVDVVPQQVQAPNPFADEGIDYVSQYLAMYPQYADHHKAPTQQAKVIEFVSQPLYKMTS